MSSLLSNFIIKTVKAVSTRERQHILGGCKLASKFTIQSLWTTSANLSGNNKSSRERINVGVLGVGRIGQLHIENVLKNRRFNLAWVLEENQDLANEVRERFYLGDTPFFHNSGQELDQLLDEDSLHGILIFTSTPSHTQLTCRALDKGKAVFVEKPAGESIEDIRKCFNAAERNKRPLLVGFKRRFDATFAKVYEEVMKGSVGKLQYIKMTTRDSPKPSYEFLKSCDSTGCNILSDLAIHDLDQLVWLTKGEKPEHIYVTTHSHDEVMAEFGEADAIEAVIKYKTGVIASIDSFRESVYGYDIRSEVFGSKGVIMANNPRITSTVLDQSHEGHVTRLHNSFPQRFDEAFQAELDHFADCVEGKTVPLITKEDNLLVAEIVAKGLESFRLKTRVYF